MEEWASEWQSPAEDEETAAAAAVAVAAVATAGGGESELTLGLDPPVIDAAPAWGEEGEWVAEEVVDAEVVGDVQEEVNGEWGSQGGDYFPANGSTGGTSSSSSSSGSGSTASGDESEGSSESGEEEEDEEDEEGSSSSDVQDSAPAAPAVATASPPPAPPSSPPRPLAVPAPPSGALASAPPRRGAAPHRPARVPASAPSPPPIGQDAQLPTEDNLPPEIAVFRYFFLQLRPESIVPRSGVMHFLKDGPLCAARGMLLTVPDTHRFPAAGKGAIGEGYRALYSALGLICRDPSKNRHRWKIPDNFDFPSLVREWEIFADTSVVQGVQPCDSHCSSPLPQVPRPTGPPRKREAPPPPPSRPRKMRAVGEARAPAPAPPGAAAPKRVQPPRAVRSVHPLVLMTENDGFEQPAPLTAPGGDDPGCDVCRGNDNWDRIILCDSCERQYHLDCLTPPLHSVPTGAWLCPVCAQRPDVVVPGIPALPAIDQRGRGVEQLREKASMILRKNGDLIKAVRNNLEGPSRSLEGLKNNVYSLAKLSANLHAVAEMFEKDGLSRDSIVI